MIAVDAYLWACAALGATAVLGWLWSLVRHDVSGVDVLWSLMFLVALVVYAATAPGAAGPRTFLLAALVALWAVRLSAHLALRSRGAPEDRRYREIRRRNEPGFAFKSLYLVFGLQAALAAVIVLPLLAAAGAQAPLGPLDGIGAGLWLIGFGLEAAADRSLARFRRDPANASRVLDRGLWRYSRHPNYFGEFLVWWGFYLIAVAAGAAWTLISPLLMSWLLLRVSGVTLLEADIAERRPAYARYVRRTNAFFPGPPRRDEPSQAAGQRS